MSIPISHLLPQLPWLDDRDVWKSWLLFKIAACTKTSISNLLELLLVIQNLWCGQLRKVTFLAENIFKKPFQKTWNIKNQKSSKDWVPGPPGGLIVPPRWSDNAVCCHWSIRLFEPKKMSKQPNFPYIEHCKMTGHDQWWYIISTPVIQGPPLRGKVQGGQGGVPPSCPWLWTTLLLDSTSNKKLSLSFPSYPCSPSEITDHILEKRCLC